MDQPQLSWIANYIWGIADDVLRDSEDRYRLVTENIADGVLLFDLEGQLVLANRSAELITGYSQEELRGRSILTLLTREGAEIAHGRMEAARDGQEMSPLVEFELVQKDGRRVLLELLFKFLALHCLHLTERVGREPGVLG